MWSISGRGGSGLPPGANLPLMLLDIRDKSKNALGMGISTVFKIFGDLLFHGNQEYPWFSGQDPNRFFFIFRHSQFFVRSHSPLTLKKRDLQRQKSNQGAQLDMKACHIVMF